MAAYLTMKTKLILLAGLVLAVLFAGCTTPQVATAEADINKVATDVSDATTAVIKIAPDVVTIATDVGTGAVKVAAATAPATGWASKCTRHPCLAGPAATCSPRAWSAPWSRASTSRGWPASPQNP